MGGATIILIWIQFFFCVHTWTSVTHFWALWTSATHFWHTWTSVIHFWAPWNSTLKQCKSALICYNTTKDSAVYGLTMWIHSKTHMPTSTSEVWHATLWTSATTIMDQCNYIMDQCGIRILGGSPVNQCAYGPDSTLL